MPQPTTAQLMENATDSLQHGVNSFLIRDEAPTAIKHAILQIYHSIELFLKARLAQVHPVLIYKTLDKRIGADSKTVGLVEVVVRLENLGLSLSEAHVRSLLELQRRRNRIEHFHFTPSVDHIAVVGQALKFLLEFLPSLGVSLEELVENGDHYRQLLEAVFSYEERVKRAEREAADTGLPVVDCPYCGESTVALDAGIQGHCFFCSEDPKYTQCERCGNQVSESEVDELGLCEVCLDYFLSQ
jgi:hypothetical protein